MFDARALPILVCNVLAACSANNDTCLQCLCSSSDQQFSSCYPRSLSLQIRWSEQGRAQSKDTKIRTYKHLYIACTVSNYYIAINRASTRSQRSRLISYKITPDYMTHIFRADLPNQCELRALAATDFRCANCFTRPGTSGKPAKRLTKLIGNLCDSARCASSQFSIYLEARGM